METIAEWSWDWVAWICAGLGWTVTADGPPVVVTTRLATCIRFYTLSTAAAATPTYFPFPFQKIAINFKSKWRQCNVQGAKFQLKYVYHKLLVKFNNGNLYWLLLRTRGARTTGTVIYRGIASQQGGLGSIAAMNVILMWVGYWVLFSPPLKKYKHFQIQIQIPLSK